MTQSQTELVEIRMRMKTRQEAFDTAAAHLLKQGERSSSCEVYPTEDVQACLYRGPNGLKCAIGALISDEHYSPSLEGEGINDHVCAAIVASGYPDDNLSRAIYARLQQVHDACDPDGWPSALRMYADRYKLEWNHG